MQRGGKNLKKRESHKIIAKTVKAVAKGFSNFTTFPPQVKSQREHKDPGERFGPEK